MPVTNIRRRVTTVATLSAAALAIAVPSAVAAGPAAAAKTEYFQLAGTGKSQVVVAHGVFTGSGKDDNSHDNYDILHLGGGTLRINHPDKDSHFKQHIDKKTCYASFTITGKYTLSNGTGTYKSVSGHGSYKAAFSAVLKKNKNGSCNENAEPSIEVSTVNASGPASL
jgi:hypothetical protein